MLTGGQTNDSKGGGEGGGRHGDRERAERQHWETDHKKERGTGGRQTDRQTETETERQRETERDRERYGCGRGYELFISDVSARL